MLGREAAWSGAAIRRMANRLERMSRSDHFFGHG
jgi:hypothetical protein